MRRLFMTLAYDGTNYCGWQIQENGNTVQQEVETALTKLHKKRTPVSASGRTDSGVHARGQVVHFDSPVDSISLEKYPLAVNSFLPRDIRVLDCREEPGRHARFDARAAHVSLSFEPRENFQPGGGPVLLDPPGLSGYTGAE